MADMPNDPDIAVLIPCFNEEVALPLVIREFRTALPAATIYAYDNNSTDRTREVATAAGAVVRDVSQQGKGNVVSHMFADIDADVYVLVDGDATYHAASAPAMVRALVEEELDMVVGCRVDTEARAYRAGHRVGNRLLTGFVALIFGRVFSDILSGYRVFSRRYVKSFPALAQGFEIEIELTVHALQLRMPIAEQATPYKSRPAGSESKLSTWRDGARILVTILKLFKSEKPFVFFSLLFAALMLATVMVAVPIALTFLDTGLVPRLPTAILATGLVILAFLALACGLILETVTLGRKETKRLAYLAVPRRRFWRR